MITKNSLSFLLSLCADSPPLMSRSANKHPCRLQVLPRLSAPGPHPQSSRPSSAPQNHQQGNLPPPALPPAKWPPPFFSLPTQSLTHHTPPLRGRKPCLLTSFRFTAKLRGRYRDSPYTILPPHMQSLLHYQHPPLEWRFITINNLN